MYNHIVVTTCFFGSIYLFGISLSLTNKALLEDKKIPYKLFVINGLTMMASGYIIMHSIQNLK